MKLQGLLEALLDAERMPVDLRGLKGLGRWYGLLNALSTNDCASEGIREPSASLLGSAGPLLSIEQPARGF